MEQTATRTRRHAAPAALAFLRGFLARPVMVGSVIPSSAKLIDRMLSRVDWASCRLFVEYGPGVGTFCRPILKRMTPGARYIAIDTNPDFTAYLRDTIDDPRFIVVDGSAEAIERILADHGADHADHILSGLPFSTLPPGIGDRIAAATERAIRPGGSFLVYQFSPKVRDFLAPHFAEIDHAVEWLNIPPAQLYWAHKAFDARDDAGMLAATM